MFEILLPEAYYFLKYKNIKIRKFRGDPTDMSAKMAILVLMVKYVEVNMNIDQGWETWRSSVTQTNVISEILLQESAAARSQAQELQVLELDL